MDLATVITALAGLFIALGTVATAIGANRNNSLKEAFNTLKNTVTILSNENKRLEERIEKLETERDETENDNEELRKEIKAVVAENNILKSTIAELEQRVSMLSKKVVDLGGKLDTGSLKTVDKRK